MTFVLLLLPLRVSASSDLALRILETSVIDGEPLVVNVEIRNLSSHTANLDLS